MNINRYLIIIGILLLFVSPAYAATSYITNMGYSNYDYPTTNYYGSSTVYVAATYHLKTYIEIPSNIGGTVDLHIYTYGQGGACSASCFYINNVSAFNQTTLTYNNQPAFYGTIQTLGGQGGAGWKTYTLTNVPQYIGISESGFGSSISYSSHFGTYPPYITYIGEYENTNTIIFSSSTDYQESEITDIFVNQPFYVNTWINNTEWASSTWYLQIMNPDNSLNTFSGYGITSQVKQSSYTFTEFEQDGTYTFRIRNIYTDKVLAEKTINFYNEDWMQFNREGLTNDNNIILDWYINPAGWFSGSTWVLTQYWYTDNPSKVYDFIFNVSAKGTGSINLKNKIIESNNFSGQKVTFRGSFLETLQQKWYYMDYITYQHNGTNITPTPIPTPYPTPTTTYTPVPTVQPTPDPDNFTEYNGTGIEDMTGYMGNVSNDSLGNINYYTTDVNTRISSYDYSGHKNILTIFLTAILCMFPAKVWTLIIFGLVLEFALLIIKR